MFTCDVDGLKESLEWLESEYRDIGDDEEGIPAFIINEGYKKARPAYTAVHLDGPRDKRPTVEKIRLGHGDWLLEISGENVDWFEYGTGMVGETNPHPQADEDGYEYDINGHGEKGWWYRDAGKHSQHTWGIEGCRGIYKAQMAMERALGWNSRQRKGR